MRFLIDTNVFIANSKGYDQGLFDKLIKEKHKLYTSSIVLAEFRAGFHRKDLGYYEAVKRIVRTVLVDIEIADKAGEYKYEFDHQGKNIGMIDHLIAATATVHELVLVTFNKKDFPHKDLTIYQ